MTVMSIRRTATVSWSPSLPHIPGFPQYLATASVAGALDASFSSQSELELFVLPSPNNNSYDSYNRIAWSAYTNPTATNGVIAGGLENGELYLYNPYKLIRTQTDPVLFHSQSHSSAVKGLDFNPIQSHLLGTGAGEGEILIWDLNNPTTPYSPGATKTPRLVGSEINVLAWNRCVPHILATSSSNGVTVVWDLKNRREVFSLNAPSSSAANSMWNAASNGNTGGMGAGNRRQGVVVAWHPNVPLQLVTALEDDSNPAIYVWDLRNAHAPLRALSGHSKGILSIAWCPKDSDLLLSCGKDNRTLCWNPSSGEILGELPHADNWCFDVQWCSRNPNWISVASFDGTVSVQPLLPTETVTVPTNTSDKDNPFDTIPNTQPTHTAISLRQPPKWLRRPCTLAFAWGNRLVQVSSSSKKVKVHSICSPPATKARELIAAINAGTLADLAKERALSAASDQSNLKATWLCLHAHFDGPSGRKLLIEYLGLAMQSHPFPQLLDTNHHQPIPPQGTNDQLLISAFIHGDYKAAVADALKQNRFAYALVLAACDGHDLFVQTRDTYLQMSKSMFSTMLACATLGDWAPVVQNPRLDWRISMIALLTYTQNEDLTTNMSVLGDRIATMDQGQVPDKQLGILMCNVLSGKVETIVNEWLANLHTDHLASPVQKQKMSWGQKCLERAQMMHSLVEQTTVFLHALHGVQANQHVSANLQGIFVEYANAMSLHGAIGVANKFLGMVPESQSQAILTLKDRLYHALPTPDRTGEVPACPYDVFAFPAPAHTAQATAPAPTITTTNIPNQHPMGQSTMPQQQYGYATSPTPAAPQYGYGHHQHQQQQQHTYPTGPPNTYGHGTPSMVPNQGPGLGSNFVPNPNAGLASMSNLTNALPNQAQHPMPTYTPVPQNSQGGWNDAPPMAPLTIVPRPSNPTIPSPSTATFAPPQQQQQQHMSPVQQYPAQGFQNQQQQQQQQYNPQVKVASGPLPPLPMTAVAPANAYQQQPGAGGPGPMQSTGAMNVSGPPGYQNMPANPYAGQYNSAPPNAPMGHISPNVPNNHVPQAAHSPPVPAATVKSSFPPGDRTHIAPDMKPVADSLMAAQAHIKQVHGASAQKRVAEDVDRRLNQLLDAVNNGTIDPKIVSALQTFTAAVDARDWNAASRVHQELAMTSFDPWMLGLKRMVDLLSRT